MMARTKTGHAGAFDKAQLQVRAPASILFGMFDLLRERHPAAPDIRGLTAVVRVWRGAAEHCLPDHSIKFDGWI
ncbi:hypothetical protein PVLB_11550 [Pseudomonas sp. VLB120]|nr:hypothetical protein PVLB_11550 [Pseudomonas sp. VLB120]